MIIKWAYIKHGFLEGNFGGRSCPVALLFGVGERGRTSYVPNCWRISHSVCPLQLHTDSWVSSLTRVRLLSRLYTLLLGHDTFQHSRQAPAKVVVSEKCGLRGTIMSAKEPVVIWEWTKPFYRTHGVYVSWSHIVVVSITLVLAPSLLSDGGRGCFVIAWVRETDRHTRVWVYSLGAVQWHTYTESLHTTDSRMSRLKHVHSLSLLTHVVINSLPRCETKCGNVLSSDGTNGRCEFFEPGDCFGT